MASPDEKIKGTETFEVGVQTNNHDEDEIEDAVEVSKHCHQCYEREPDFIYPRCGHLNSCYICINEAIAENLIPRCNDCNKALWKIHYVGPTIFKQV